MTSIAAPMSFDQYKKNAPKQGGYMGKYERTGNMEQDYKNYTNQAGFDLYKGRFQGDQAAMNRYNQANPKMNQGKTNMSAYRQTNQSSQNQGSGNAQYSAYAPKTNQYTQPPSGLTMAADSTPEQQRRASEAWQKYITENPTGYERPTQSGGSTAISPGLQRVPTTTTASAPQTGGRKYFDPGLQRMPTPGAGETQQQANDRRMEELAANPNNYRDFAGGGQYFDPGLQQMPATSGGNQYGETIRTQGQSGTQVGFDNVNYDGSNEDFRFFGKPSEEVMQADERQRYGKTAQELFAESNPGVDPSGNEFEKFRNLLPFTHGGVTNQNYLDPGAMPSWDSTLQSRRFLDLETTSPRQFEQLKKDMEADRIERQFQETGWRPQQYSPEVSEKMRNPDWENLSQWHKELVAMQEGRPIEQMMDRGEDANDRRYTDVNQVPSQGGMNAMTDKERDEAAGRQSFGGYNPDGSYRSDVVTPEMFDEIDRRRATAHNPRGRYDPTKPQFRGDPKQGLPENIGDWTDEDLDTYSQQAAQTGISHMAHYYRGEDGNIYQSGKTGHIPGPERMIPKSGATAAGRTSSQPDIRHYTSRPTTEPAKMITQIRGGDMAFKVPNPAYEQWAADNGYEVTKDNLGNITGYTEPSSSGAPQTDVNQVPPQGGTPRATQEPEGMTWFGHTIPDGATDIREVRATGGIRLQYKTPDGSVVTLPVVNPAFSRKQSSGTDSRGNPLSSGTLEEGYGVQGGGVYFAGNVRDGLPEDVATWTDDDIALANKRNQDSFRREGREYFERQEDGSIIARLTGVPDDRVAPKVYGGRTQTDLNQVPPQGGTPYGGYVDGARTDVTTKSYQNPDGDGYIEHISEDQYSQPTQSHYGTVSEGHQVPANAQDVERMEEGGNEVIRYTSPDGVRHQVFLRGDETPPSSEMTPMSETDVTGMNNSIEGFAGNLDAAPSSDDFPGLEEVMSQYAPVASTSTGVSRPSVTTQTSSTGGVTSTTMPGLVPTSSSYTPSTSMRQPSSSMIMTAPAASKDDSSFDNYAENMQQFQPSDEFPQRTGPAPQAQAQPVNAPAPQNAYIRQQQQSAATPQQAPQAMQQSTQAPPITTTAPQVMPQGGPAPSVQPQFAEDVTQFAAPGSIDVDAIAAAYSPGTTVGETTGMDEYLAKTAAFEQQMANSQPQMNFGMLGGGTGAFSESMAQRDAFINRINEARRPAFANPGSGAGRNLDFGALLEQAGEDVQGGFQNPFTYQNFGSGPGYR